jgi:hypothetical protein
MTLSTSAVGLLLQPLAQLLQKSDVLDSDGRLVGKRLNQSDLLVRKRSNSFQVINIHNPK